MFFFYSGVKFTQNKFEKKRKVLKNPTILLYIYIQTHINICRINCNKIPTKAGFCNLPGWKYVGLVGIYSPTFNLFADVTNKIQSKKKAALGGDRRSAAFYFCVLVFRRSQEDRVLFPEVNWSEAEHRAQNTSDSAFPAAGKDGDTSKSVFVQPLDKYPFSRLCLAEETALDWDSETIIGGSVLLGLLL